MRFDKEAFLNGIAGAVGFLLLLALLHGIYGAFYDSAYNQGFERGAYVERVCPQARTFHCPIGDYK